MLESVRVSRHNGRFARAARLVFVLATAACVRSNNGDTHSGETHFLRSCDDSCAGDLSCVCGVCTTECTESTACEELSSRATCAEAGKDMCPTASVCEVLCAIDADCLSLSADHRCRTGVCRAAKSSGSAGDASARDASSSDAEPAPKDGGGTACGPNVCPVGQRCCDHCLGSCVAEAAELLCPDDNGPSRRCDDAAAPVCAGDQQSCLVSACCAGLVCCSGTPIPNDEAVCYASSCPRSDRNLKTGFATIDHEAVLKRVLALPISSWRYKDEAATISHIGPMAQDFKASFGVGVDDKYIFPLDEGGVSLAAIQALHRQLSTLARSQQSLREENAQMRAELARMREELRRR